jgi:hypothetical protein
MQEEADCGFLGYGDEDGENTFFRIVGNDLQSHTAAKPTRPQSASSTQ